MHGLANVDCTTEWFWTGRLVKDCERMKETDLWVKLKLDKISYSRDNVVRREGQTPV